ncbi:unnamed protein product [Amoebophrya sp. A120]|nr:unnamed protein product [Amoebophrya sp. A120]|eukprot:GSA120T00018161001.1
MEFQKKKRYAFKPEQQKQTVGKKRGTRFRVLRYGRKKRHGLCARHNSPLMRTSGNRFLTCTNRLFCRNEMRTSAVVFASCLVVASIWAGSVHMSAGSSTLFLPRRSKQNNRALHLCSSLRSTSIFRRSSGPIRPIVSSASASTRICNIE